MRPGQVVFHSLNEGVFFDVANWFLLLSAVYFQTKPGYLWFWLKASCFVNMASFTSLKFHNKKKTTTHVPSSYPKKSMTRAESPHSTLAPSPLSRILAGTGVLVKGGLSIPKSSDYPPNHDTKQSTTGPFFLHQKIHPPRRYVPQTNPKKGHPEIPFHQRSPWKGHLVV